MATRTNVSLHQDIIAKAMAYKPNRKSLTQFIEDVVDEALDSTNTLGKTQPAGQVFTSTNKEEKEERVRARVRDKAREGYTPEFQEFWKTYQACTHRANSQSKPKAFEEWRLIVKDKDPLVLRSALNNAIKDIERRLRNDEFAAPMPDCFRWLRDGKWEVHTEDHTPQPQRQLTEEEEEAKHLEYLRSMGLA